MMAETMDRDAHVLAVWQRCQEVDLAVSGVVQAVLEQGRDEGRREVVRGVIWQLQRLLEEHPENQGLIRMITARLEDTDYAKYFKAENVTAK